MYKLLLLGFSGLTFGVLTAAGVFTVLSAVGLIPRLIGATHSAKEIWLYEDMVMAGTILGGVYYCFSDYAAWGALGIQVTSAEVWRILGTVLLIMAGVFSGMFTGCLALAIAEMLDSIPIFTRRISFRHGLGCMVLAIALGKLCGSLYFFVVELSVG